MRKFEIDKEGSINNKFIEANIQKIDDQLLKLQTKNGKLGVSVLIFLTASLTSLISFVFSMIPYNDFDVIQQLINFIFLGVSTGVSVKLLPSIYKNKEKIKELEREKAELIKQITKNLSLEEQSYEIDDVSNKPKTKKIVYFPNKNEEN